MGADSRVSPAEGGSVFSVEVRSDVGRSEPACHLLAERGLQLFRDSATGPCTGIRLGIGYVAGDAESITLAHLMRVGAGRELFPTFVVIHADVRAVMGYSRRCPTRPLRLAGRAWCAIKYDADGVFDPGKRFLGLLGALCLYPRKKQKCVCGGGSSEERPAVAVHVDPPGG
jgi:hypothetical protein